MALLAGNLGYVGLCSFVMVSLTIRYGSLASRYLSNLRVYVVPEDPNGDGGAKGGSAKGKQAPQVRNRKKMSAIEKEDTAYSEHQQSLGGAGWLSVNPLPKSVIEATRFFRLWDTLVFMFVLLVLNVIMGETGKAFGLNTNNFIVPMCYMAVINALYTLCQTEALASDIVPRFVLYGTVALMLLNFGVSLSLLFYAPTDVIDFSVEQTSEDLMPTLVKYLKAKNPKIEIAEGEQIDPVLVKVALATVAAVQGGLVFGPALRVAKMYYKVTSAPPPWGEEYMRFSIMAKLLVHLQLLLPMVAMVLWVKPLVEMWGLQDDLLDFLKPLALISAGMVTLPCLRPMLQAYLNLALGYWYDLKHGGKPSDRAASRHGRSTATLIRIKIQHNQALANKVAIQLFSQAVFLVGYGAMLYAGTVDLAGKADLLLPTAFWRSFAGFLGWWSCTSWFLYVAIGLLMHRVGIITA